MQVIKGSLDTDQNIICLVYETDGVAGPLRSPGCNDNNQRLPFQNLLPLQNMVSAPNLH